LICDEGIVSYLTSFRAPVGFSPSLCTRFFVAYRRIVAVGEY
jgi:hypothetical protein